MKTIHNSWIDNLAVYEPGRPMEELARELGLESVTSIIKLASNENAFGPSPKAMAAIKKHLEMAHLYPDGDAFYLRQALSKKLGIPKERIIIGAGSNEIIEFLAHVYLNEGKRIVMSERAFIIFKLIAHANRADVTMVPMKEMRHDLKAMLNAITHDTKLVFIANPNNPTGTIVSPDEIEDFMAHVPHHVAVIFDEAYIEMVPPDQQPNAIQYLEKHPHVYILRTFSKAYGLAGLRVGYGIATEKNINLLHRVRQPFNVNALGLIAAQAALDDEEHVRQYCKLVWDGLRYLEKSFTALGLSWVPSCANFILVNVGNGRLVFKEMQKRHVIVRPVETYGLPEYVRITVGTHKENEHCVKVLREVLKILRAH